MNANIRLKKAIERWPMNFANARRAVNWADGYLLRPRLKSQMGQIIKRSVERKELSAIDSHGMLVTSDRLRDLAETISVCLAGIENPAGSLYRHVYGRSRESLQTAEQLARLVWDGPGSRQTRTFEGMRDLATLLIEDMRRRERTGKGLKIIEIARSMRIKRDAYYDNWAAYGNEMREHLRQWLDRVERELTSELADRGIL